MQTLLPTSCAAPSPADRSRWVTSSPAIPSETFRAIWTQAAGGALETGRRLGPEGVLAEIRASGLRGRGGGWFPTGFKWSGLATADAAEKYVVCNAAEGEPGTFKDRAIWRHNPYQVIEGLAVAAFATGASAMYIGVQGEVRRRDRPHRGRGIGDGRPGPTRRGRPDGCRRPGRLTCSARRRPSSR